MLSELARSDNTPASVASKYRAKWRDTDLLKRPVAGERLLGLLCSRLYLCLDLIAESTTKCRWLIGLKPDLVIARALTLETTSVGAKNLFQLRCVGQAHQEASWIDS